jgi:hypothetical protein
VRISVDLGDPKRAYLPGGNDESVVHAWPKKKATNIFPRSSVYGNGSIDRPDLRKPVLSSYHVPRIGLPAWLFLYAELFAHSFVPLWLMQDQK